MPSIPADAGAFFDENDLANLDGVLDFDNIGGHNGGQMDAGHSRPFHTVAHVERFVRVLPRART